MEHVCRVHRSCGRKGKEARAQYVGLNRIITLVGVARNVNPLFTDSLFVFVDVDNSPTARSVRSLVGRDISFIGNVRIVQRVHTTSRIQLRSQQGSGWGKKGGTKLPKLTPIPPLYPSPTQASRSFYTPPGYRSWYSTVLGRLLKLDTGGDMAVYFF